MKTHFKALNVQCSLILNAYVVNLTYSTQLPFIRYHFQLLHQGAVLIGINRLVFQKELIQEGSLPISPYTQHHLLGMKSGLWCGWWWFISLAPQSFLFNSKEILVKYPFFIACYNLFFKWNIFVVFKQRIASRNPVKGFCFVLFLLLFYVDPEHQND